MEWVGGNGVRGPIKNGRYHVEQFFNHLVSRGVSLSYIAEYLAKPLHRLTQRH